MKSILLLPTKNESWILKSTINSLKNIFDNIIVSDQASTDSTLEILMKIQNLSIIQNPRLAHSNIVRRELLDEARKQFGKNNLIVCIDADEFVPINSFIKFKKNIKNFEIGTGFSSPWVQLWRSVHQYRNDKSVWNPKNNFKDFMFIDDGNLFYKDEFILNDHTSRIPTLNLNKIIKLKFPLLHFQFVNWERAQLKQIWYMCNELIEFSNAQDINKKYFSSRDETGIKYSKSKKSWLLGLENYNDLNRANSNNSWHLNEIKKLFDKYGSEYFLELDIWNNKLISNLKN